MTYTFRLALILTLTGGCRPVGVGVGEVTALVDVQLVTLEDDRVLPGQTVLVRDGKISAVGAQVKIPAGARVIEGHGRYLLPGLADMHAHLVREEELLLFVARGVTTVRNMWGTPTHLEWRARVASGELLGPSIYTAGPILDGERPEHDGSLALRTPEEAERAVAMHKQLGYDFIKVYSGLSRPVYQRILQAAKAAGLPVAGHIPREVGLLAAAEAGQLSVEHLTGFFEALQADDSPVRGKFDRASRQRKSEFVDEKKLPQLRDKLHDVWSCPTRTVMTAWGSAEEASARLAAPEMRYVSSADRAIWAPGPDEPAALKRSRRDVALLDRIIGALDPARLVVGTDTGNPLVVSGFSVHDELQLLHRAGLSNRDALRAATRNAAEMLHADFGRIAVGQRADFLLIEDNPLADLAATRKIAGVMARGRWLDAAALSGLCDKVAAAVDHDPFRGFPDLPNAVRYDVTWKGAWVGSERVALDGEIIRAQGYDAHTAQRLSLELPRDGSGLTLNSDGPAGRGRVELTRTGARGRLLGGFDFATTEKLAPEVLLDADKLIAGKLLLGPRLLGMTPGQSLEVRSRAVALGSALEIPESAWTITCSGERQYQLQAKEAPPMKLTLDEKGWPTTLELEAFGDIVRISRIEGKSLPR